MRERRLSLLIVAHVAVVVSMLAVLGGLLAFWLLGGAHPGDAYTYLAAGQRLNAGHLLYTLSPGDSERVWSHHDEQEASRARESASSDGGDHRRSLQRLG